MFICLVVVTKITENSIFLSLTISVGTILYHGIMRLIVGFAMPKSFNYKQNWFREYSFEKKIYTILKVKKWKKHLPSYNPDSYSTTNCSYEEIANTMCRNEIIHECDVVLSFVPISFSIFFGALPVFVLTSILAGGFDLLFVIMQRYNRPRIVKLINRKGKRQ